MQPTGRLFVCARCRAQVIICRRCDRGQIYCNDGCSQRSRQTNLREAARRYQRSRRGRMAHAQRMRRYRDRRNKVTHHGSAVSAANALLPVTPTMSASTSATVPPVSCHFCRRACSAFVRLGPLRHRVFRDVRTAIDYTGHGP